MYRLIEPFLDGDDGGSGGGPGDPSPTPAGSGDAGGTPDAKFTQADVDRLIADRLNREGIKDLKKKATEYDKIKAAEQTDTEKLQARMQEMAAREQQIVARERRATLRDEVARAIAADKIALVAPVSDVLAFLDADSIEWSDAGQPVNVAAQLKTVLKERPYLVAKRTGSADGGAGNGQGGNLSEDMNTALRRAAGRAV